VPRLKVSPKQVFVGLLLLPGSGFAQQTKSDVDIPLIVPAGTPLRLEIVHTCFPKQVGETVRARLAQPVFAFDREVLPAGTEATGHIIRFTEPSRLQRFESMLQGRFGSFKRPDVQLDTLSPDDGMPRAVLTHTAPNEAQEVKDRWNAVKHLLRGGQPTGQRCSSWYAAIPAPSKISNGSRFDAVLLTQENFGYEKVPANMLQLGVLIPQEGTTYSNLVTGLDSALVTASIPPRQRPAHKWRQ
jgi:hypothetical protein